MDLQLITRPLTDASVSEVSRETMQVLGGALLGDLASGLMPAWPVQRILPRYWGPL